MVSKAGGSGPCTGLAVSSPRPHQSSDSDTSAMGAALALGPGTPRASLESAV